MKIRVISGEMKVYYSKTWGIIFIVAGLVLTVLNFILFDLTGEMKIYRVLPGVAVVVVGILYMSRVYFEVTEKELITYSLLGFVAWRYTFIKKENLIIENEKRIYYLKNGKKRRIRVNRSVCNKMDWEKLVAFIEGFDASNELHG